MRKIGSSPTYSLFRERYWIFKFSINTQEQTLARDVKKLRLLPKSLFLNK